MDAYQCDECKDFFSGEPALNVTKPYRLMSDPPELHFCGWNCLVAYGENILIADMDDEDDGE